MNREVQVTGVLGHILVADDEGYLRRGLRQLLTLEHYHVTCAKDGVQGLELFEALDIDLVITDVVMPCMDGIQLLERIRSQEPSIPVILLTGHTTPNTDAIIMPYADCELITKPFDPLLLLATVKRILEESKSGKSHL